jgi:hypothetical protein
MLAETTRPCDRKKAMPRSAVPSLVIVPGDSRLDFESLYGIATAYAQAGLIVSHHGHRSHHPEFAFPAVVCSSFAIELFLKFFLMVDRVERGDTSQEPDLGHTVPSLWSKVTPTHKDLIAGMFRNSTGEPHTTGADTRLRLFEEALNFLGDKPFVQWRYVHELAEPTLMSHEAINLVLDALGYAAQYLVKKRRERSK